MYLMTINLYFEIHITGYNVIVETMVLKCKWFYSNIYLVFATREGIPVLHITDELRPPEAMRPITTQL